MKVLSVKQPWANLIAEGKKTIEVRSWRTQYRGQLLIASSKSPNIPPAGFVLAVVDLVDCRPMTRADEKLARCNCHPGHYAWVLANVRETRPVPISGALGVFDRDVQIALKETARLGAGGEG